MVALYANMCPDSVLGEATAAPIETLPRFCEISRDYGKLTHVQSSNIRDTLFTELARTRSECEILRARVSQLEGQAAVYDDLAAAVCACDPSGSAAETDCLSLDDVVTTLSSLVTGKPTSHAIEEARQAAQKLLVAPVRCPEPSEMVSRAASLLTSIIGNVPDFEGQTAVALGRVIALARRQHVELATALAERDAALRRAARFHIGESRALGRLEAAEKEYKEAVAKAKQSAALASTTTGTVPASTIELAKAEAALAAHTEALEKERSAHRATVEQLSKQHEEEVDRFTQRLKEIENDRIAARNAGVEIPTAEISDDAAQRLHDLEKHLDTFATENKALKQQLATATARAEEAEAAHEAALEVNSATIKSLRSQLDALLSEKASDIDDAAWEELDSVTSDLEAAEAMVAQLRKNVAELRALTAKAEDQTDFSILRDSVVAASQAATEDMSRHLREARKTAMEASAKLTRASSNVDTLETRNTTLKNMNEAKAQEVNQLRARVATSEQRAQKLEEATRDLDTQVSVLHRQKDTLERFLGGDVAAMTEEKDAEIARLNRAVNASLTTKFCAQCYDPAATPPVYREREFVLAKCGHTFCGSCVDQVFKNRNRKCPQCGVPIGPDSNMVRFILQSE